MAITTGLKLPGNGGTAKLAAIDGAAGYEVQESDLDAFIDQFERLDPGRRPPVATQRELLVEARHQCAVCRASLAHRKYHHILSWERLKHHDPKHMIAVCGTCHDYCDRGNIDRKAQYDYKGRLAQPVFAGAHRPFDASTVKHDRDLETLRRLFSQLTRGAVARFLDEAMTGYLDYRWSTVWSEGFIATAGSQTFYLHDTTAARLVRDFVTAEVAMEQIAHEWMKPTATEKLNFDSRLIVEPGFDDAVADYRQQAVAADAAWRTLYAYIRETYVEIDFDSTDAVAWSNNAKYFED